MDIFPAIDLKDGQCVRLTQGDFDTAKMYASDPLAQAKAFEQLGAVWLHVVDLDGARAGAVRQLDILKNLAVNSSLKIQAGGGIRDAETIEKLLAAGIQRVVVGSLAVKDPKLVSEWIRRFGREHVTLAFDVRWNGNMPEVLTHGWQSGSKKSLWDVLDLYKDSGLLHVLCTDVSRDGMMTGTNVALYQAIQSRWPMLSVLASGGVSNLDDLLALAKEKLAGAIVGKALYEGKVDLAIALQKVRHAR